MVRLTILYPNVEGKRFDKDYYLNVHIPLSLKLQGEAVRDINVEFGFSGGRPGIPAPYVAICQFLYDSMEDFERAFLPHAEELMNDIVKYTDTSTVIQFSEVMLDSKGK